MNEAKNKVKNSFKEQKRMYLVIITIMLVGLILGIIFSFIISKSDHTLVKDSLNTFFKDVNQQHLNYTSALLNSVIGNTTFIILIWLLGISIIGIPIIGICLFFKGFIFGFSFSSIIYTYKLPGVLKAIAYSFPHHIIALLLAIFLGFYAIFFSKKLFHYLFLKKDINLKYSMKRYVQVLVICLVCGLICSLSEVFLGPFLINLFS